MLLLSSLVGRRVRNSDGYSVGRLADLVVATDAVRAPIVDRILLHRSPGVVFSIPWTGVQSVGSAHVQLCPSGAQLTGQLESAHIETDEILLVRDILDTQIIDVVGQRLARVADVVLARRPVGRLEMVGVEVGFGAVLRRLWLVGIAKRMRPDVVAWSDLHVVAKRGHAIQLATQRSAVHRLSARELATLVVKLDTESATDILAARGPTVAAEVIQESNPEIAERVLRAMSETAAHDVIATMPTQHAARWRDRLAYAPPLRGRRLLRSRVWSRRRHPRDHHP